MIVPDGCADAEVSIELFPIVPTAPSYMTVGAATAALMSLTPQAEGRGGRFECAWLEWPTVDDWERFGGEGLTGCSWTAGSQLVSIGTEDQESLETRLPTRFGFPAATVEYDQNFWGVRSVLPVVPPHTEVSAHFGEDASEPTTHDTSLAAWYAVDLSHRSVRLQRPRNSHD